MAVYTSVSNSELAAFLEAYDLGAVKFLSGIKEGVENTNYHLRTERGDHILTLYEKRVKREDLPFFIEVMEVLARAGLNCPRPVETGRGDVLGELNGRPCAIFTFLEGTWSPDPNAARCEALGKTLARLHLDCSGVERSRANALGPSSWKPLLEATKTSKARPLTPPELYREDKVVRFHDDDVPGYVEGRLDDIVGNWPEGLPGGVIHADLFPNNALFSGDKLTGVIDFYFACEDYYAYDLAICLNSWCFQDGAFDIEKCRAMISGYQRVRGLEQAEIEAMPVLASGAAMRFFLTRLYDWVNTPHDALVSPKDPKEYWHILLNAGFLDNPRIYDV